MCYDPLPDEPFSRTQGRGAGKTELKKLIFDEFFRSDMQWGKSALYKIMVKTANQTVERLQKEWLSWELYEQREGKDVAQKQKEQNLVQDSAFSVECRVPLGGYPGDTTGVLPVNPLDHNRGTLGVARDIPGCTPGVLLFYKPPNCEKAQPTLHIMGAISFARGGGGCNLRTNGLDGQRVTPSRKGESKPSTARKETTQGVPG